MKGNGHKTETPDVSHIRNVEVTHEASDVSVIGVGMRSHSGVAAKMFEALSKGGINIVMISTSEIKTAVIVDEDKLSEGANVVHEAFGLGGAAKA